MSKKTYFRTVNGVNGVILNKHIEFLTGKKAINYEWSKDENTYIFYVKKEFEENEKSRKILEAFCKFYKSKIVFV